MVMEVGGGGGGGYNEGETKRTKRGRETLAWLWEGGESLCTTPCPPHLYTSLQAKAQAYI